MKGSLFFGDLQTAAPAEVRQLVADCDILETLGRVWTSEVKL